MDALFDELEATAGREQADAMREAVASSPFLAGLLQQARARDVLDHVVVSEQVNSDGHYDHDSRSVHVEKDILTRFHVEGRKGMLDRLTVVLAHETGHTLYTADGRDAVTVLDATVRNGIRDGRQFGEPYLDLTSAVEQYRLDRRQTEGYAELMALNALSSRVNQERTGSLDVPEFLKRAKANSNCVI